MVAITGIWDWKKQQYIEWEEDYGSSDQIAS